MKVLFIIHDVYQDDNYFPLGSGYLASILTKENYKVDIYSMDVFHYSLIDLSLYLKKNEYDIIGVGFLAARFNETIIPLCKVVNKYKKNAWLVLGGYGPSPIPEYILEKTKCDAVVVGEAENSILQVLQDKQNNENKKIYYATPIQYIDTIPFPAWDLFPMERYISCTKSPGMDSNDKYICLLSSRGCVNACSFCYRMTEGIRLRKISNVVEEIKYLNDKYGINYFEFSDECFLLNKRRLETFYSQLQENNLNIKFWCAARIDNISEDILSLLKESGCQFINYGFESMDNDVLKRMNKNVTTEKNEYAARITKEAGINFGVNMIWGNPFDTKQTLWKSVEFIKKYNSYSQVRTIRPVTPYPGCELYYYAIKQDLLKGPKDFFSKFKNSDLITVNFTDIPVNEMYQELYKANKELILDHFKHTNGNMKDAESLVNQFYNIYFSGNTQFRGVRTYAKT